MITSVVPNVPVTKVEIDWTIVNQDMDYFPMVVNTRSRPVREGLMNGSDAELGSWAMTAIAAGMAGLAAFTVDGGHNRGRVAVRDPPRRTAGVVSAEQFDQPGGGRYRFARLEGSGDIQAQQRQITAIDLPGAKVNRMAGGYQASRRFDHSRAVQHLPRVVIA